MAVRGGAGERRGGAQLGAALRRQKAISEFSLFALREADAQQVIQRAVTLTAAALGVEFCTVLELESSGGALRVVAGHGWPSERLGMRLAAAETVQSRHALELYGKVAAKMLEAPRPVVIDDLRRDDRHRQSFRVRELGVMSSLCVVIPAADRPHGTLVVHSRALRRFETVECEFVQAVANVLAAALARSRSHAELKKSEARFRALTELSSDWYWEQDENLRFVNFSEAAEACSGSSAASQLGRTRWELPIFGVSDEQWHEHRAALQARRPFSSFEYQRLNERGETVWISTSGVPIFDSDGRFLGYRGVGSNITKRKRAQEALTESERRYRALFELSPEPMYLFDSASFAILAANQRMVEQYGWSREELERMSMLELRPPEERSQVEEEVRGTGGMRVRKRRRHWRRGGEVFDVEVTARDVLYGGRAARMVIAVDMTELQRIEQVLREQRRLLGRAQALAGLGYWEYDPAAGMVKGSRELRRKLGLARELPPQTPGWSLEIIHPDDRAGVRSAVARCIAEGAGFEIEVRVAKGQRIMIVSGEAVKDRAGRVTKVIGSCLDITEQRGRENALCDAADQLQALSRRLVEAQETERRRLSAELHDQVGQNLTALGINLDILAQRANGLDADAKRRLLDSLKLLDETALRVEGVLDDLRPPMLDDLGLGPALRWVADEFSTRTEIPTRFNVQGAERRFDRQNEIALLRIVQEALNNVAKHACAERVELTLVWQTDGVRVEVADDGKGFARGGSQGRQGFGLASMRERIQAANGLLNIDSAPGEGTRVRALVPG